jgi:chromosome segregation ATPase
MWLWWIFSVIICIAVFIFIYRLFVSSYEFLPAGKKFFFGAKRDFSNEAPTASQEEIIRNLKNTLQSVEETASFYEIQFSKFQQRLKSLEEQNNNPQPQPANAEGDGEEDWKELYYEENERKEKLENELDEIKQRLEEAEEKLQSVKEESSETVRLKSDYDSRLNDLESMQNNIGLLQRQLEAAAEREKELEQILLSEISLKKKYAQLESDHLLLKIQNDELRREVVKLNQKERPLDIRLSLNEPERIEGAFKKKKKKG